MHRDELIRELAKTILVQLYPEVDDAGHPYLPYSESLETIIRLSAALSEQKLPVRVKMLEWDEPGVHVHGGMPDDQRTSHALTNLIGRAKDRLDAMTPAEREEMYARQRENYARGMAATCEHGFIDFEQCPKCRETALKSKGGDHGA